MDGKQAYRLNWWHLSSGWLAEDILDIDLQAEFGRNGVIERPINPGIARHSHLIVGRRVAFALVDHTRANAELFDRIEARPERGSVLGHIRKLVAGAHGYGPATTGNIVAAGRSEERRD